MSTIRVRKLDSNHDTIFGSGKADYVTDLDAVVQLVKTHLLLFKGEWWEDLNVGLPMFQSILGNAGSVKKISAANTLIQARIMEVPHVVAVKNVSGTYDPNTRAFTFEAVVDTEFGAVLVTNNA